MTKKLTKTGAAGQRGHALFCWKESSLLACGSKDSVKAISDVAETPYFQKFSFDSS